MPTAKALSCGALVNSAGAWALDIAERFGETAPLFPAGPPQFVTEPFPYMIEPLGPGRRRLGDLPPDPAREHHPRRLSAHGGRSRGNRAPVPPAKTLAAMRALARVAPMLAHCHVIRVWSGIEAYLPDMIPVIGPSETTAGLFHAFGFCGHGFQIGPGVGSVLAEIDRGRGGPQTPPGRSPSAASAGT